MSGQKMSIGIVFAGVILCAHAQWLKQAAEDFQRHQADLENAAGLDERPLWSDAPFSKRSQPCKVLAPASTKRLTQLSCRSTNFWSGERSSSVLTPKQREETQ
jgi:hypothetical protein